MYVRVFSQWQFLPGRCNLYWCWISRRTSLGRFLSHSLAFDGTISRQHSTEERCMWEVMVVPVLFLHKHFTSTIINFIIQRSLLKHKANNIKMFSASNIHVIQSVMFPFYRLIKTRKLSVYSTADFISKYWWVGVWLWWFSANVDYSSRNMHETHLSLHSRVGIYTCYPISAGQTKILHARRSDWDPPSI